MSLSNVLKKFVPVVSPLLSCHFPYYCSVFCILYSVQNTPSNSKENDTKATDLHSIKFAIDIFKR